MLRRGWTWLLLLTGLPALGYGEPEFRSALSAATVALAGQVTVDVRATWREQAGKGYRILTPLAPEPKKLRLDSVAFESTSLPTADGVEHTARFLMVFVPVQAGQAETGPIQMRYLSQDIAQMAAEAGDDGPGAAVHRIESLSVTVTGVSQRGLWTGVIAVVIGLVACAVFVVYRMGTQAQRQAQAAKRKAGADAGLEADALERLMAARTLRIEGDVRAYVGRVAELLADYTQRKFGAGPTDAALSEHLGTPRAQRLAEIMAAAEDIRYAGRLPGPDQLDRMAAFAAELVREHMPEPEPMEGIRLKES